VAGSLLDLSLTDGRRELSEFRARAKRWLPQGLVDVWGRRSGRWSGLEVAADRPLVARESGPAYTDPIILDFVERATRQALLSGTGYERDGLLFQDEDVYWPILGPLLAARRATQGTLRVVDIGGSLGSKWLQHRTWLELLSPLRWAIVEQSHYVERARTLPYPEVLTWHHSLEEAAREMSGADVAVFSSSLQYLPDPLVALTEAMDTAEHAVVIDRATVANSGAVTLGLQHVQLYDKPVTYPCWLLPWRDLVGAIGHRFEHLGTWTEPLSYAVHPAHADAFFGGVFGLGRRR
jgi:putative methyltransferase (TIGR04325 family)